METWGNTEYDRYDYGYAMKGATAPPEDEPAAH